MSKPTDPGMRSAQSAKSLGLELSALAGAAPSPATLVRVVVLLVRAVRLLRR